MTIDRWGLLVSWGVVAGCATTSSDFRLSEVGRNDAAIAGRISITYNGKPFNENCTVTFGTNSFKLSPNGIVLFSVPKGWTALTRLECKDGSVQHVRLRGAHFFAQGNGRVSDFGDVAITWNAEGGYKPSSMFGLVGALVDEASDDGSVIVSVKRSSSEVREAFLKKTGSKARWADQLLSNPGAHPGNLDDESNAATAHGFFCTSAPSRSDVNPCTRKSQDCERIRAAIPIENMGACTATPSAWCYVSVGQLRCYGTRDICEYHAGPDKESTDLCAKEF